MLTASPLAP